jgi:hypothetical protein
MAISRPDMSARIAAHEAILGHPRRHRSQSCTESSASGMETKQPGDFIQCKHHPTEVQLTVSSTVLIYINRSKLILGYLCEIVLASDVWINDSVTGDRSSRQ